MKKQLYLIITLVILVISCNKDENEILFTKNYFPVKVGNWWKYQVSDYSSHKIDTLTIRITSVIGQNGVDTFNCHYFILGKIVDSSIIIFSDKEISFIGNEGNYYFGNIKVLIPFKLGNIWIGSILDDQDTIKVTSYNIGIKLLEKSYDVYDIERHIHGIGGGYIQSTLISKNIGIVKNTYSIYGPFPGKKMEFILIDYKIY